QPPARRRYPGASLRLRRAAWADRRPSTRALHGRRLPREQRPWDQRYHPRPRRPDHPPPDQDRRSRLDGDVSPMTPQELLTQASLGAVLQGETSYNSVIGRCYYRHPDKPLCCAVRHLLDDEQAKLLEHIASVTSIWHRASLLNLPDWFVPN